MFYSILPESIISLIYSYDNTYHEIFKVCKKQLYVYGFTTRLNKLMYSPCLKQRQLVGVYRITFSSS